MLDPWRPGWFRLAVVAVVATVVLLWYALLRRRIGAAPLAAGALGLARRPRRRARRAAPGGSYLAALPALAGALAGIVARSSSAGVVHDCVAAWSAARSPSWSWRRPSRCSSPRWAWRPAAAPAASSPSCSGWRCCRLSSCCSRVDGRAGRAVARRSCPAWPCVLAVACTAAGLVVDRFDAAHPVPDAS